MHAVVEPEQSSGKGKKLLDQMRDCMRLKYYSLRTEQSYCDWVERFIRYHRLRYPREMREVEVGEFLTHLARDEVHKLFSHLQGTPRLMVGLLYGSGLRLMHA